MFDYLDFRCNWIHKTEIWKYADDFFAKYWPEGTLPVDIEKLIEDRLGLNIEPEHSLLSQIDMDAFLKSDLTGIVVDYDCYMRTDSKTGLVFPLHMKSGILFSTGQYTPSFGFPPLKIGKILF